MSKVAIVTAASMGMGKACAIELINSGYKVIIMSRGEEILNVAKEIGADAMQGSITCKEDIVSLVKLAMNQYGRIDAVVNNAGYIPKGDFFELSDENWHEGLDIVIGSVNTMLKLVTPIFQSQGGGSVVNISTYAAYEPSPVFPISACLRAALGSYIKLYADKYAKDNIRINNVLPGFVDSKPVNEKFLKDIPMGRYGKVEEIAKTVRFLLSEDASYTTGQNIRVDGGITRSV
ncbi:SDR family oxidoreductase [Sulfurospirillum arcachonense]|uniref:SDR family oxidoreductase n=1 Tax=Sulfurospirillum arcachonense TaxID=57666 RepID=UPI00046A3AB2|nr:SDR family oxidoreductase [Sulfurospirillum arcachonense]